MIGMSIWRGLVAAGLFFSAQAVFCQEFSFGVIGGLPITSSVIKDPDNFTFVSKKKAVLGATGEFSLPAGLAVEGDFLFHPFNLEVGSNPPPAFTAQTLYEYTTFEIPALLKARFTNGMLRPFVLGGPIFRGTLNNFKIAHYGVTMGGGIEFGKRRLLRFAPQLRYTRWGADSLITVNGSRVAAEQANQLQVLVEILY